MNRALILLADCRTLSLMDKSTVWAYVRGACTIAVEIDHSRKRWLVVRSEHGVVIREPIKRSMDLAAVRAREKILAAPARAWYEHVNLGSPVA